MYYVNAWVQDLYRVKFHENRSGVLRLDMNENPSGLPETFVEEVKMKITPAFLATYPNKDTLASLLADLQGLPSDSISITNGSDEAMRLLFQCFSEAGKTVVTVSPTFEMYDIYSKMFGMQHREVAYRDDFTVQTEAILDAIDRETGMVVLLNPNSPIGTVYEASDMQRILEKAKRCGALVIIDEAYHYFCSHTFLPLIRAYEHVAVLRTFSKLFSIAGLRIGYVAGAPDLIRWIENAQSTFNVNAVAVLFATELLRRPDLIEVLRREEAEGHRWLEQTLRAAGYAVRSLQGNYVLLQPRRPAVEVVEALKRQNIWIRAYGRGLLAGWLRVTTGNVSVMQRFLKCFIDVEGEGKGKNREGQDEIN